MNKELMNDKVLALAEEVSALEVERDRALALLRDLARFHWHYDGYGHVHCVSCGGTAYEDEGKITHSECGGSCPFASLDALLEGGAGN